LNLKLVIATQISRTALAAVALLAAFVLLFNGVFIVQKPGLTPTG
jgi:hypothetical protein